MALPVSCKRDVGRPRDWVGLVANDAALLATWIARLERQPDELYTSVGVGCVPAVGAVHDGTVTGAAYQAACSWRVDAVLRFGPDWWVVECKPAIVYAVIGQVLFYRYWWSQMLGYPAVARWVVLTDAAEPDVLPVCRQYGIDVIELGDVLDYPRHRRRMGSPAVG